MKRIDWKKISRLDNFTDFICVFANWYFMFLMAFTMLMVGLNFESYNFVILQDDVDGPGSFTPKPPGCIPGKGWDQSQWNPMADDVYLKEIKYWENRCKMREVTQEQADEFMAFYIYRGILAAICIVGLTMINSRARKKMRDLKKAWKSLGKN